MHTCGGFFFFFFYQDIFLKEIVMGLKELVGQCIAFCKITLGSIEESGIKDIVAGNIFHILHKS